MSQALENEKSLTNFGRAERKDEKKCSFIGG